MWWSRSRLSILLAFCLVTVATVRLLPRSLAGVAPAAQQQARQEIAARLEAAGERPVDEAAVDAWIAAHPAEHRQRVFELEESFKAQHRFRAGDGREHPYLGDLDSYLWLRLARNHLRHGSPCDRIEGGRCRDEMAPAPVGREQGYASSVHTAAIVALHRAVTPVLPGFPLSSTSYYVPVLVGVLGVIPAFLLGWRFGGTAGAVVAALAFGTNPAFLVRSVGSDNDVWNVVLPLFAVWACVESLAADAGRRLVYAAAAGFFVALHAATWRGWPLGHVLVGTGFAATAVYAALRHALQRREMCLWRAGAARKIATSGVVYFAVAGLGVTLVRGGGDFAHLHLEHLVEVADRLSPHLPETAELESIVWPSNFAAVAELHRLGTIDPAGLNANVPLLILAFAGAALLALPRRRWRRRHCVVLAIGAIAIVHAYSTPAGTARQTATLLFPALLALFVARGAERSSDEAERGALVLIIWLGAAYFLAASRVRFVMFLAPPAALGLAVFTDRVRQFILAALGGRLGKNGGTAVSVLVVAALLAYPLHRAWATARAYLPQMNDAWWDTLSDLRASTPADAIIHVWWHDGHWTTYAAERRAIADGASLKTHVPYWFTRALLTADEQHSTGLLRMLACGSDATPYPEGAAGAYGKLRARGLDAFSAQGLVDRLAALPSGAASAELRRRGFSEEVVADVLASSHCDPPPSYVVLSNKLATAAGWSVGQWDFRRAFAARRAARLPADEAIDALVRIAGYSRGEARELYRKVPRDSSASAQRQFISPELGYLTSSWLPCSPGGTEATRVCPLIASVSNAAHVIEAFEYGTDSPAAGRLRIRDQTRRTPTYSYRTPGTILIAGPQRLQEVHPPAATDPGIAVLIDTTAHRILLAEAALLRSTFTKLMFLDGRYLTRYEKIRERSAYTGERVVTYEVHYDRSG